MTDHATILGHLSRQLPTNFGESNRPGRIVAAATAALDLGLTPSKRLTAALTNFDRHNQKATEHRATLATGTPLDLTADDYPQQVRNHVLAAQVRDDAEHITRGLLATAAADTVQVITEELPDLLNQLDTLYQQRYPDLLSLGDTRQPTAVLAAHHDFAGQLSRAHRAFMATDPQHNRIELDYRTDLWLYHRWTPEAWQKALNTTGPAMSINRDVDVWHFATRCGATPRLARSHAHAVAEFRALDDANEQRDILEAHARSASAAGARSVREAVKNYIH